MSGYGNFGSFASDEEILAAAQQAANETGGKKKIKRSEDARFWKPNINNEKKLYQALVRVLPRDKQGKLPFSVRQDMHYIKENGVFLTAKCRKTLGDKEFCPICDANWKMYKTNQKDLMERAMSRKNQTTYIANFLIMNDLNRPEFNGQVKLWEHRKWMNDFIMAPMTTGIEGVLPEDAPFGAVAPVERFVPYNPNTGRNLRVKMEVNPKNDIPTYENSTWDKVSSAFANNIETYEYIMAQVLDLNEFIEDVPTIDELTAKLTDFNDRLSQAGQDPGAQRGFVQGGFGVGAGMPAPTGFAPPGQPIFPQAPVQSPAVFPQAGAPSQASIPASIPGWNVTGFQNPPPVVDGNSAAYFNGATPTQGMEFKKAPPAPPAPQAQPDDDLPF